MTFFPMRNTHCRFCGRGILTGHHAFVRHRARHILPCTTHNVRTSDIWRVCGAYIMTITNGLAACNLGRSNRSKEEAKNHLLDGVALDVWLEYPIVVAVSIHDLGGQLDQACLLSRVWVASTHAVSAKSSKKGGFIKLRCAASGGEKRNQCFRDAEHACARSSPAAFEMRAVHSTNARPDAFGLARRSSRESKKISSGAHAYSA